MEADEYAKTIADALEAAGMTTCGQSARMSHLGWGETTVSDGTLEGVAFLSVQQGNDFVCSITIETEPGGSHFNGARHTNLGFAVVKPGRTGSTLWRIAEGYVNGYPLQDILWYVMTRCWFPRLMRWEPLSRKRN